jgi:hypothetical protein
MKPVAIIGTNKKTRDLIDWNLDADYWVFNEVGGLPWPLRVDGVFQMHMPEIWRRRTNVNDRNHYDWLQQPHPFPIWMQEQYTEVPSSVRYPREAITEKYLTGLGKEIFTSTPDYAIALAIYQDRPKIHLFGIEMGADTEFYRQRPGCYFWAGIAISQGIEIVLPSKTLLFQDKLYGYEREVMIGQSEVEMSMHHYAEEAEKLKVQMFEAKGASQKLLDALMQSKSEQDAAILAKMFKDSLNEALEASYKYGQNVGATDLCAHQMAELKERLNAAGLGEASLERLVKESVPA